SEIGSITIYGFIYSFRDSYNSSYPDLKSENTYNAIKMIKKIKNEISNDELSKIDEIKSNDRVVLGDTLFMNFRYATYANKNYIISPVPGAREGISNSIISGFNYAINKYIDEDHQFAAKHAIKYFIKKNVNKKIMLNSYIISPVTSLLDDKDICERVDCELIKSLQMENKMFREYKNYNYYSETFRKYVFEYVFGDKPLEDVIKNIERLTKIYNITFNTEDTCVGLIFGIVIIVSSVLMLLSIGFLFIDKYKSYFTFFPTEFWILLILGCFFTCISCVIPFDTLTIIKCAIRISMMYFGLIISLFSVLYKLLINYPIPNKISIAVKKNGIKYIISNILIILILIFILCITSSFSVSTVTIDNGKNFQKCDVPETFVPTISNLLVIFIDFSYSILISFLIFVEWSIVETSRDIKLLIPPIFINIFCLSLVMIMNIDILNIDDYVINFLINNATIFIISITHYFFFYGIKVYWAISNKRFENDEIDIEKIIHIGIYVSNSSSDLSKKSYDTGNNSNIHSNNNNSSSSKSHKRGRRTLVKLHNIQHILSSNKS
ncbi:hypothetical protein PIROE2DRAFT_7027, partial [Piromyces sp. E2]